MEKLPIDKLIDQYGEELTRIYEERSAGDYTFIGILVNFVRDLRKLDLKERS